MLRFRLKTLMIWFAILSVLLAWASTYLLPSYRERDRIAEVSAVGSQVFTEPRGQFFLRQFIGDSLSERAVYVHLRDPRVTDDWLVNLQGMKYIEVLSINRPSSSQSPSEPTESESGEHEDHQVRCAIATGGVAAAAASRPSRHCGRRIRSSLTEKVC